MAKLPIKGTSPDLTPSQMSARVVGYFIAMLLSLWLQGLDLNQRHLGYEPSALPDCATLLSFFSARAGRGATPHRRSVPPPVRWGPHPKAPRALTGESKTHAGQRAWFAPVQTQPNKGKVVQTSHFVIHPQKPPVKPFFLIFHA